MQPTWEDADKAYQLHHTNCTQCQGAGRRPGQSAAMPPRLGAVGLSTSTSTSWRTPLHRRALAHDDHHPRPATERAFLFLEPPMHFGSVLQRHRGRVRGLAAPWLEGRMVGRDRTHSQRRSCAPLPRCAQPGRYDRHRPPRARWAKVEAPDVLCGGTPCQAFSVAGLRQSLLMTREEI